MSDEPKVPRTAKADAELNDDALENVRGGNGGAQPFEGLPMGDRIGGPLADAANSQILMANATADFISKVTFPK